MLKVRAEPKPDTAVHTPIYIPLELLVKQPPKKLRQRTKHTKTKFFTPKTLW